MGNVLVSETEDEFDPWIGLVLGDTWWRFGKNVARVTDADPHKSESALHAWIKEIRAQLEKDHMTEALEGVSEDTVMLFVTTVMSILERKFDGKNIAKDVLRLTKRSSDFNIYDRGRFLDFQEPSAAFWAVEYDFLFSRLDREVGGGGWLNAVARCSNSDCGIFFIKSRIDQRHHTATCRTREANRSSYKDQIGRQPHSRRGRPRLKR